MPVRKKHVVFVLPGAGRVPYHFSTLQHLVGSGHRLTVISCRGRPVGTRGVGSDDVVEALDRLTWEHGNFSAIFEGKSGQQIRDVGPDLEYAKTPRSNYELFLLRSYSAYLRRLPESNFYVRRWKSYLPEGLRERVERPWARWLLRQGPTFRLLSWLERRGKPDPKVVEWLRSSHASVVVASPANSRNSLESDYLFAAHHLGIPTAVPVLSWDNLTTKGLIPFGPSLVLAWNREHSREARDVHHIPPSRIVETGSPFFDKWFDRRELLEDRAPFARRLGLDPDRPILVYLGSSRNVAENESWLVRQLLAELRGDARLGDAQLVVRPHPANNQMIADLSGEAGVVCLESEVPFGDRSIGLLMNTLAHCLAVVGINTSGMVDALALDKPCFSIRTDRYSDTHLEAAHFRHMVKADAIVVADDVGSLTRALGEVLEGRDDHRPHRQAFVREFLRPCGLDKPAGKVSAEAILLLAEGKTGPEIAAALQAS